MWATGKFPTFSKSKLHSNLSLPELVSPQNLPSSTEEFHLRLENIFDFLFASKEAKCCLSIEIYAISTNANCMTTQSLETGGGKGVIQLESISDQIKFRGRMPFSLLL